MKKLILFLGFIFLLGSTMRAQSKDSVCARIDQILKYKIQDKDFVFKKIALKDGSCSMELTYLLGSVERFELNAYIGKVAQNFASSAEKLSPGQLKLIMDTKITKILVDEIMVRTYDGVLKKITGSNAAIILEQTK